MQRVRWGIFRDPSCCSQCTAQFRGVLLHLPSSSQFTCRARQALQCCNNPLDTQSITPVITVRVLCTPELGTALHPPVSPVPGRGSKDIKRGKIKFSIQSPLSRCFFLWYRCSVLRMPRPCQRGPLHQGLGSQGCIKALLSSGHQHPLPRKPKPDCRVCWKQESLSLPLP